MADAMVAPFSSRSLAS